MTIETQLIQTGTERYQPISPTGSDHELNQRKLAFFVGVVAVALPTVMAIAGLLGISCDYDSISHFYYARFLGGCFVGALVFIGTYLLAYQGLNPGERHLSTGAGYCAFGVALFPTTLAGCEDPAWSGRGFVDWQSIDAGMTVTIANPGANQEFFMLFSWVDVIHLGSALVLFLFLAWFSLFVFTREVAARDRNPDGSLSQVKQTRNRIYRTTGYVILVCIGALAGRKVVETILGAPLSFWNPWNMTFVFEAIALYAFGLAWMVKGRFWNSALMDE